MVKQSQGEKATCPRSGTLLEPEKSGRRCCLLLIGPGTNYRFILKQAALAGLNSTSNGMGSLVMRPEGIHSHPGAECPHSTSPTSQVSSELQSTKQHPKISPEGGPGGEALLPNDIKAWV